MNNQYFRFIQNLFDLSEESNSRIETFPNGLQLSPIELNEDFINKYNVTNTDFVVLTKNGVPISNNLYRKGGLTNFKKDAKYFILIKYVPDVYSKDIMDTVKRMNKGKNKVKSNPNHLSGHNVLIDMEGNELFVADKYNYITLIDNSVLFLYNGNVHSTIGDPYKAICKLGHETIKTSNYIITSGDGNVAYQIFKHSGAITTIK